MDIVGGYPCHKLDFIFSNARDAKKRLDEIISSPQRLKIRDIGMSQNPQDEEIDLFMHMEYNFMKTK